MNVINFVFKSRLSLDLQNEEINGKINSNVSKNLGATYLQTFAITGTVRVRYEQLNC